MSEQLSPNPIFQSFLPNGAFNVGGKVFTFVAGTSTPQATFTDATGSVTNTNPIILNSMGQAAIWLNPTLQYKYVVQDGQGNPLYTTDNINGALSGMAVSAQSLVVGPPPPGIVAVTVTNVAGSDAIDVNVNQATGSGFVINAQGTATANLRGIFIANKTPGGVGDCVGLFIANDTNNTFDFGKQMTGNPGTQFINGVAGDASFIQSGGTGPVLFVLGGGGSATVVAKLTPSGLSVNGTISSTGAVATGALTVTGTLTVTGAATLGSLSVTGTAATGALAVTGTAIATAAATSASAVAPVAGGSATCGVLASSTANLGLFFGTGPPTFSAAQGSIYSNTTGAAGARLYCNTSSGLGTTWTALTTP